MNLKALIAVLFATFGFFTSLFSQDIEALKHRLNSAGLSMEERVEVLNLLCRDLTYLDPEASLKYGQEALEISQRYNYREGEAFAFRNLSNIHVVNGIYSLAMDYLQVSMDIFSELEDSTGLANCYISLGHLYRKLGNEDEEIEYFKRAYHVFLRQGIPDRIAVSAHNLGESYYLAGDYDRSRELTHLAIVLNDSLDKLSILSSCYKVMGLLEYSDENYREAEKYFIKVLELSDQLKENSQKVATIESLVKLSYIYKGENDPEQQIFYLNEALTYATTYGLSEYLTEIYTELLLFYNETDDRNAISTLLLEYSDFNKRKGAGQLEDRMALVDNLVEVHSLQKDNQILLEDRELRDEIMLRRNIVLAFTIFGALFLIYFLLRLHSKNRKISHYNSKLLEKNEIIEQQKLELESVVATKDKILSIIGHDLKGTFNVTLGFSELLKNELREEQDRKILDNIIKGSMQAQDLLDQLLKWAASQSGDMSYKPENLEVTSLIKEVIESVEMLAREKEISIIYDETNDIHVFVDHNMFRTVLRNLVQNAVKFSPQGNRVIIEVAADGEFYKLSVKDFGQGIEEEVLNDIFKIGSEKIRRGTANEHGSGLGLVICKGFVEKWGGKIWVESRIGEGSTFFFTILSADSPKAS